MSLQRAVAALAVAAALGVAAGCAETRSQASHVDDESITTTVKTRLVEDKSVDADATATAATPRRTVMA